MRAVKQMAAWTLATLLCVPLLAAELTAAQRVDILMERADAQLAAGKTDDALKSATLATELSATNPRTWAALGRVQEVRGDAAGAAAAYDRYAKLVAWDIQHSAALAQALPGADAAVASVNGKPLMHSTLVAELEKQVGSQALGSMISKQLLEDAITAAGIIVTDDEVAEQIETIKQQFPAPETFAQALSSQGMTEADLVQNIRLDLQLKQLATKHVAVTDEALAKYLEENRARLDKPEMVTYSEILVADEAQAKELADKLSQPDADFAALAGESSMAYESVDKGGKVGPCPRGAVNPPQVAATLTSLKVGETSAPVKDEAGWRIVRLDEVTPAVIRDLTTDRKLIDDSYKMSQAKQPQQLMAEVRAGAKVEILDPKYADLQKAFAPAPEAQPEGGE